MNKYILKKMPFLVICLCLATMPLLSQEVCNDCDPYDVEKDGDQEEPHIYENSTIDETRYYWDDNASWPGRYQSSFYDYLTK